MSRGRKVCSPMSVIARRNTRRAVAGTKEPFSSVWARICKAWETGPTSSSAKGVGSTPLASRTNSGSPYMSRRRASAWLIAGWLSPSALPAAVRLRVR